MLACLVKSEGALLPVSKQSNKPVEVDPIIFGGTGVVAQAAKVTGVPPTLVVLFFKISFPPDTVPCTYEFVTDTVPSLLMLPPATILVMLSVPV